MNFKVKTKNNEGQEVELIREATDKFALYHDIKAEGYSILSAEEIKNEGLLSILSYVRIPFISGITTHDKIIFAKNVSAMLEAGLSLARVLSVIERQTKNQHVKKIVRDLEDAIKKGTTLSDAMKKTPSVFSPLFIAMTQAGEESGKLADALHTVGSQMEKTYVLQQKIKGAMMYPSIILCAMLAIAFFLLTYVVPTLTATFKQLKINLPASTVFIITVSDICKAYGLYIIIGAFLSGLILYFFAHTKIGSRVVDWLVLHIPIVAPLVKETNSARTARTFASLISSGVPVMQSISITKDVIQNSYYADVLEQAKNQIEKGQPIARVFAQAEHLYPSFVGEMIAVGEETGELSAMLLKVAVFYEQEVEQKTKDMSTVIEPVLMLIIGVAVGFFAIAMIGPTYSLVDGL